MAEISLKFTNRNGRFCLCATVVGTTTRHYKAVTELLSPDFKTWNKFEQKFVSRRQIDRANNQILAEILNKYKALQERFDFPSGKELFEYERDNDKKTTKRQIKNSNSQPSIDPVSRAFQTQSIPQDIGGPTLGEWIEHIISDFKNPKRLKPSASYQGYLTLLHELEREGDLVNKPISVLDDDSFVQFIKWINKKKSKNGKGNNFISLMKLYTATLNKARRARLTAYHADFPYMEYAPVHKITDKAKDFLTNGGAVKSLTEEQYKCFEALDVTQIRLARGAIMEYYKNLYKDFCILLYEMKSRPIDIISLHWDNIAFDEVSGRYTCTYIPAKKKNYGASSKHTSKALVIQYLTPKAVEIVMKYKGRSSGGYVFPFELNQRRWNLSNPQQFHYHYYKANHINGRINKFLHRVGEYLGLPFQLTLYAFRRTAITHAIIENKMPITMIAKIAGTSVEMIEAHYANYLHALAAY